MGTDFAVDVDNDPYSAIVYECKVPLSDLDSEGNFSDDLEIIGFAFRSTDAIDSSTGNYSSSASDTDTFTWGDLIYRSVVIPEFFEITFPIIVMIVIFPILRRKRIKKTLKNESRNLHINGIVESCMNRKDGDERR